MYSTHIRMRGSPLTLLLWVCLLVYIQLFGAVSPQLFVTNPINSTIYQVDLDNPTTNQQEWRGKTNVVGITYDEGSSDPSQERPPKIVYSDLHGGIYTQNLNETESTLLMDLSPYGTYADRMGIEITTGNVYFNAIYFVGMVTKRGVFVVIFTGLEFGRELAVDGGLLYWSDHGSVFPHIGVSELDGTAAHAIVHTDDIVWPNGLTVDRIAETLYWVDGSLKKIEKCDLEGNNRVIIVANANVQFMDILVDGELLYVTEWTNNTLRVYHKDDTNLSAIIDIPHNGGRLDSIVINSTFAIQNKNPINEVCAPRHGLGVCSDACLPSSDGNVTCGCNYPDVVVDGRKCPDATLCPLIENGNISSTCSRFLYETCDYSCDDNYEKTEEEIQCVGTDWNIAIPCLDIDECVFEPCEQICTNTDGNYTCSCVQGYEEFDEFCFDIDECSLGQHTCEQDCINTEGSFACSCFTGYNLENDVCTDIDECVTDPCEQNCINTPGNYTCSCVEGYEKFDEFCFDIDECESNPCPQNCTNTPGSYSCSCNRGYKEEDNVCVAIKIGTLVAYDLPFITAYLDSQSSEHIALAQQVTKQIDAAMNNSTMGQNYIGSTVNNFSEGSVLANVTLSFNSSTTEDGEPIDPANITTAIVANNVPNLTISTVNSQLQLGQDECDANIHDCEQECTDRPIGFFCSCFEGYRVDPANQNGCLDIDECSANENPCAHTCSNTLGSYSCSCVDGYTIDQDNPANCIDIDECENDTCEQVCSNSIGSYSCNCFEGYDTDQTDESDCTDIDECSAPENPCAHNCSNTPGSYTCSCAAGYTAGLDDPSSCIDIDECDLQTDTCGQVCSNSIGSYSCNCFEGYDTDQTDESDCTDIDECSAPENPCAHNCSNTPGSYTCSCAAGYTAGLDDPSSCIDIDECSAAETPCAHECTNTPGSFSCSCHDGYTTDLGDPFNCVDIDECSATETPCAHECTNTPGSFSCSCHDGYTTDLGDPFNCVDVNECTQNTDTCNQVCTNSEGSYTCACFEGYDTDSSISSNCIDINECEAEVSPCLQICSNLPGSYACTCKDGYIVDPNNSSNCIDVNECTQNTNICHQMCTNSEGSYTCACFEGYDTDSSNSSNCIDINECEAEVSPCLQICINTPGSYACTCTNGYIVDTNNPSNCTDVDECTESTNICHQLCTNSEGGYTCGCFEGYDTDPNNPSNCIDTNECALTNTCEQQCINLPGDYTCECFDGYSSTTNDGSNCNDIDECESSPCSQFCTNSPGGYSCSCDAFHLQDGSDCIAMKTVTLLTYNLQFVAALLDPQSLEFSQLGTQVTDQITTAIINSPLASMFIRAIVNEFSEGSVIANVTCSFNMSTTEDGEPIHPDNVTSAITATTDPELPIITVNSLLQTGQDECAANISDCEQECTDQPIGYFCSCYEGYSVDPSNRKGCLDIDECEEEQNICQHECFNTVGSYKCECDIGYILDEDNEFVCQDIDECQEGFAMCVQGCINTNGSYTCTCSEGYIVEEDNPINCIDVDECAEELDMCTQDCNNTLGSYTCECFVGFRIAGDSEFDCTDIDECEEGLHMCTQECINAEGSYSCTCGEGFIIDENNPFNCIDIDECAEEQDMCEQECVNTIGSYKCDCDIGFAVDDNNVFMCTDKDECAFANLCEQQCINTPGSYVCDCFEGYSFNIDDGTNCTDIDECANSPCSYQCTNTLGGYFCSCKDEFLQEGSICIAIKIETQVTYGIPFSQDLMDQQSSEFDQRRIQVTAHISAGINNSPLAYSFIGVRLIGFSEGSVVAKVSLSFNSSTMEDGEPIYPKNVTDAIDANTVSNLPVTNIVSQQELGQDECAANISGCEQECTDFLIGYLCSCYEGYRVDPLNRKGCIDIDECAEQQDMCQQECVNTIGSYTCGCGVGYTMDEDDEFICTDIDECEVGIDMCAQECIDTEGSYTCTCGEGYMIDEDNAFNCKDEDECISNPDVCVDTCENTEGSYQCTCGEGYVTDSLDPTKCRVPLLHYGNQTGDSSYTGVLDGCTGPMQLPMDIPLFGQPFNNLFVSTNGLVTFGSQFLAWYPASAFWSYSGRTIIAPLFTDIDLRYGGFVYINQYSRTTQNQNQRKNVEVLERYVRDIENSLTFNVDHVVIATWRDARTYPAYYRLKTATFQMALVTDWTNTYAIFIYGEMQWDIPSWTPGTLIGYLINGGVLSEISHYSFTEASYRLDQYAERNGVKGILLYDMGSRTIKDSCTKCSEWYNGRENVEEIRRQELIQCPCTEQLAQQNRRFYHEESNTATLEQCYITWPSWRAWPNAMRCCYDNTHSLLNEDNKPGGFVAFHPRYFPFLYNKLDHSPWINCCKRLCSNCALYRELRPLGDGCFHATPNAFAALFGDPHIVTLDGQKYTFNGWGEYKLLTVIATNVSLGEQGTSDVNFDLQGRTERAITSLGSVTDATVFTAFAATDNVNGTFHVQLDNNKTGLILYGNGADLSSGFNNFQDPFNFTDGSLVVYRENTTLHVLFTTIDISLEINKDIDMISISASVPKVLKGLTSGLLGNFDNDTENDFTFRNGTKLDSNSTEGELFPFGQSWMVESNETLFLYFDGLTYNNYSHPEFVPRFLDDEDPDVVANATLFCGEKNLACIYDLVLTGNEDIAQASNTSEKDSELAKSIENNNIPVLNGSGTIFAHVNEEINVFVQADDESAVEFQVIGNASLQNVTEKSAVLTWVADINSSLPVSVVGVDSQGQSSPAFHLDIVLCNGCSDQGQCDYTQVDSTSSFPPLAKCICHGYDGIPYWSGTSCEIDYDGCSTSPCSVGQECEDLNATEHETRKKSYHCGPCPDGYEDDGIRCTDINECDTDDICEQICANTEPGFNCMCESGFRILPSDHSKCQDINECDEALHECEHICINTFGAYNCSCYAGYTLDDTSVCVRDSNIDECELIGLNCSSTAGCTNETGEHRCFCKNGYELSTNGDTCININECKRNACPQKCVDTIGRFTCSCYTGYRLQEDKVTCQVCDSFHWGKNCANECVCGQGTESCDHVHGCICRPGWTGRKCDLDINECKINSSLCAADHQDCYNSVGSYFCQCDDGYELSVESTCKDIDECDDPALNACQHQCSNVPGSFVCSCNQGFLVDSNDATQCTDFDECESGIASCEHICENVPGQFNCYCHFGYTLNSDRSSCRLVEDLCAVYGNVNCSHICKVEDTTVSCDCPNGLSLGANNYTCKDVDECASGQLNRCSYQELCINIIGGYTCSCPSGESLQNDQRLCKVCDAFHYGKNCAEECDCGQGSDHCDPVRGCICKSGWLGKHCEVDKDECEDTNICTGEYSVCVNEPGGYSCTCEDGYKNSSSGQCKDINECVVPSLNSCDQICLNTNGSYACQCQTGFIFKHGKCEDIDECSGRHGCQQLCHNTLGGYRCSCDEGYKLNLTDRRTCSVIDQCNSTQTTECYDKHADCVILEFTPTCKCWKGYEKSQDGSDCQDIKECEAPASVCDQICTDEPGSFTCSCLDGYFLDRDQRTCTECNEGDWGPNCQNTCKCLEASTASCNKTSGTCQCQPGFHGSLCELNIDECSDNTYTCPTNSECRDTLGSYSCVCGIGFVKTGDGRCSECEADHWGEGCGEECVCNVLNTETCNNVNGSCFCRPGWRSHDCSIDTDECASNDPCQTDTERCTNTQGSFKCDCKDGFVRNENGICIDLDECLFGLHSCHQKCKNTYGEYLCDCFHGYQMHGDQCEVCPANMFGYNCSGMCECNITNVVHETMSCDSVTGTCLCKSEWEGQICDSDVDECKKGTDACLTSENRVCLNRANGYDCVCETGYQEKDKQICEQSKVSGSKPTIETGIIIGASVGGGLLICLTLAAVCICCQRMKTNKSRAIRYEDRMPREYHMARHSGIEKTKSGHTENMSSRRTHLSLNTRFSLPRPSVYGMTYGGFQNDRPFQMGSRRFNDYSYI